MTDTNKLFRDYATRVSFNMTLSRNQIHTLRCIVIDIELEARSFDDRILAKSEINRERVAHGFADNFIAGQRSITSMGLIQSDPRAAAENDRLDVEKAAGRRAERKYWGPVHQLTPAGEHVVALLRLAGLIHPAVANSNAKPRRKRA